MTTFQLEKGEIEVWRSSRPILQRKGLFSVKQHFYALTNKRAVVLEGKKGENLVDSCYLVNSQVAITAKTEMDKAHLYDYSHKWARRTPGVESVTIGTLVFMTQGRPPMSFVEIENPESAVELAEKLIKDSMMP
jgi:hypothetical protein